MPTQEQKISVKLSFLELRGRRTHGLCVRHKEDVLGWKILSRVVWLLTLGKVSLIDQFWTTIGNVVYVPRRLDQNGKTLRFGALPFEDYRILSHELKHVEQFYLMGFPSIKGGRALGVLLMGLLYFFVFFPVGLAYARYRFEREAYMEGLVAARVIGLEIPPLMEQAIRYCSVSPWYLWMWPFPQQVRKWFESQFDARCHSALRESPDA
jgi:hypothetical protein